MISVKNLKKTHLLGGEEVHALDDVSLLIKEWCGIKKVDILFSRIS